MKTLAQVKQAITDLKLSYTEVTGSSTGYPEPLLGFGVTGFLTFEDAEDFRSNNGGQMAYFSRKAGWSLMNVGSSTPFECYTALDQSTEVDTFSTPEYLREWLAELDFVVNPESVERVCNRISEVQKQGGEVSIRIDKDADIHVCDEFYPCMGFTQDSTSYMIGVYFTWSYFELEESESELHYEWTPAGDE